MINFILLSIILMSNGIDASALKNHYSIIENFANETCIQYQTEKTAVFKVIADEYVMQLNHMKKRNKKKTKIKALFATIGWCKYWRNSLDRLELTLNNVVYLSKGEVFFKSLKRR